MRMNVARSRTRYCVLQHGQHPCRFIRTPRDVPCEVKHDVLAVSGENILGRQRAADREIGFEPISWMDRW